MYLFWCHYGHEEFGCYVVAEKREKARYAFAKWDTREYKSAKKAYTFVKTEKIKPVEGFNKTYVLYDIGDKNLEKLGVRYYGKWGI